MKTSMFSLLLTLVVSVVAGAVQAAEDVFFSPELSYENYPGPRLGTLDIPGADNLAVRWGNPAIPILLNPENFPWWEYGALTPEYLALTNDEDRRAYSLGLFEKELERQSNEEINGTYAGLHVWYAGHTDSPCDLWQKEFILICFDPSIDTVGKGVSYWWDYTDPKDHDAGWVSMGGRVRINPNTMKAGEEWDVSLTLLHEVMHALGVPHLPRFGEDGRQVPSIMGWTNMLETLLRGTARLWPLDETTLASLYPPPGPECALPFIYDGLFHIRFDQVWSGSYQFTGELTLVGLPVDSPTPLELFQDGTPTEKLAQLSGLGFAVTEIQLREPYVYSVTPCGTPLVQGAIKFRIRAALFGRPEGDWWLYLQDDPSVGARRITGLVPVE